MQISGTDTINSISTLSVDVTLKTALTSGDYFTFSVPSGVSWIEDNPTTCIEFVQGHTISCTRTSTSEMRINVGSDFSANVFHAF